MAKPEQKPQSDSSDSEESSDESLILEGELVRNPDAPDSSDSSDDEEEDTKEDSGKKRKKKGKQKSKKKPRIDRLQVEFLFCDMNEKYFHGLKSLLHSSSSIYQAHSSELADQMIANVAVGTLIAQDNDDAVYGFASVISFTTYQETESIQYTKKYLLSKCPADRKEELAVILSGKTNKPAGLMLHGRMINVPMEIVGTLHDQLHQDLEWAKDNADEDERDSLKFGLFLRIAPCTEEKSSLVYKYFDDEVLANQADLTFTCAAPTAYSREDEPMVQVMVLTRDGYTRALQDLKKLINA